MSAKIPKQITFVEDSAEYRAFVDKFKQKKTTDDCYTPENVYEVVVAWCVKEYGINREDIVRPFWPGGDYERFDYPGGCVVLDNPPFSIVSKIAQFYEFHGIKYFLFSPYLTNFTINCQCHVIAPATIEYENGAKVDTAFITNLDTVLARTAPELTAALVAADKINRKEKTKAIPKYVYPDHVLTAAMLGYISKYGIDFRVRREDAASIRALDHQRAKKKSIFGSGFLLSEKAAAEKAAAERWQLSEREWEIVRGLGEDKKL